MAKIDNEKLTAAKKTLRAEIEERRAATFTPTDAVEDLKAEIIDMATVGYSIQEIEERLKASLGLNRVPMTRVRKILREAAEGKADIGETTAPSSPPAPPADETSSPAPEPEEVSSPAPPAEIGGKAAPASPETAPAAKAPPLGTPSVSSAVSAIKASLQGGSAEKPAAAPSIKQAAEAAPPPQPAIDKKEVQDGTGTGNGTKLPEGGG